MNLCNILSILLTLGAAVGRSHHRPIDDGQALYARNVDGEPYAHDLHARDVPAGYNEESLARLSGGQGEGPLKGEGEQRSHLLVSPTLSLVPLTLPRTTFDLPRPALLGSLD